MKTYTKDMTISIGDNPINVTVEYTIENDGIGHYEFWGATGYDTGFDYPLVENIIPLFTTETGQERDEIDRYIDEHFEILSEWIEERL